MKKILRILKNRKYICFFDLEATQHSQEMIAVGAVLCLLDKKGNIKKRKPAFREYVKAKNKIGNYVINLTGITEEKIAKEGVSFLQVMKDFKKYVGVAWKKCLFVSFGNHDLRIFNQTIAHNLDSPMELCHQIHTNYWDFGAFISQHIKDNQGHMMSLIHYCELFNLELATPIHDPAVDAINLANLYEAFLKNTSLVAEEYKKLLVSNPKLPQPICSVLKKLANGESVSPNDFDDEIVKDFE